MDAKQRERFYLHTGSQDPESYIQSLRDEGKSTFTIMDSEYIMWETGFSTFCMENYQWVNIHEGIEIQL